MLELNHLYRMDCMEGMARFPDGYFELAIVDPPYGIGENGSKNASRGTRRHPGSIFKSFAGNDLEPPGIEYFQELRRVSRNQIIWGANHFISRIPFDSHCWIVWDKDNTGDFADCELAWTSFSTAVRKFRFRWNGMLQENMRDKEVRIHPTQKPVALYRWLLSNYARPGDKILDTHAGSASSFIAAHEKGHDYIGFELDPDYHAAASKRVAAAMAQGRLFDARALNNQQAPEQARLPSQELLCP